MIIKTAVFVFADTGTAEGLGRVVNAMVVAKELKDAGDEVRLYFDGTGTRWPEVLSKKDHVAHQLYESIKDRVAGACLFCAGAFGAKGSVQNCNVQLVDEYAQHVSVRALVSAGFQVMNF